MPLSIFQDTQLSPKALRAAETAPFIITLQIGPDYTPGPSRIIFDFPGTVGMSRPSLAHQEDFGYIQAYVNNPEVAWKLRLWDTEIVDFVSRGKSSWRGMAARMAVLDLDAGLKAGDVVEFHWGDTGRGYGPSVQVTSVVPRRDYECVIHVRYFADQNAGLPDMARSYEGQERPTPDLVVPLAFKVGPRDTEFLRVIRKADKALLLTQDAYWNVAEEKSPEVHADAPKGWTQNSFGVFEYADKNVQVKSKKLPLLDGPDMGNVVDGYNIYWGDIHTHTAFSVDCFEREKMDMRPGDLMAFARQRAGLDFYAPTDHHEPHHSPRNHIGRERWEEMIESLRKHDKEGEFLVFPGFEYRCKRGDTVVILNWLAEYAEINRPEWENIQALWEKLQGKDYLTIPHFHNGGGLERGDWWKCPDPCVEPVVEMFSCHGSYERPDAFEQRIPINKSDRPDRFASWMLENGHQYGFVCNSDGHKGHVGSNGITAVFAKSLDKASILEAYRARRVYGSSNARIRLVFQANGQLMGAKLPNVADKEFRIDVAAEAPLKKVELFRNMTLVKRYAPEGRQCRAELKLKDERPGYWHVRATQQDNQVAWSSPVWFE
jgi:hypothetical protein